MMPPNRILHVISAPRAEGTVRLVLDWLQCSQSMWQSVFALSSRPNELTKELTRSAAAYHEQPALPNGWKKFPWMIWHARKVTSRDQPDMVICWNTGFAWAVLLGARLGGCKRLLAHAGNPPHISGPKSIIHSWLNAITLRILRGQLVCCSHYVASAYREQTPFEQRHLHVVWNCAQLERFKPRGGERRRTQSAGGLVVLMVATLEKHKDHKTLLQAFVMVRQALPLTRLQLAGEGSLRGVLESQARQLGIFERVDFLGSCRDVPSLLGQADLFVFSTTPQEGLGTVLIEALASGIPIIASDVAACREVLQGGRWGQLVPAKSPHSLATVIIGNLTKAVRGPDRHALDSYLENFTVKAMQAEYLKLVGLVPVR